MPIPDYQTIMLPLLGFLRDGHGHHLNDAVASLAAHFKLTDQELRELLPSGTQEVFKNRIGWARTYLKHAGLVESPKRGFMRITDRGLGVLAEKPDTVNVKYLERFNEFQQFRTLRRPKDAPKSHDDDNNSGGPASSQTPIEALEAAYEGLRDELAADLLEQIKKSSPSLFERLVVELLVKMGYGGSRKDAGQAIGRTRDEGIDGIIKEDRLGLDIIYIQAKRWDSSVGRPEVQKFAGALQGQRARKGVFITTSSFTKDARDFAAMIDSKIVLIDGEELAQLLIDHDVAVTPVRSYEVKRVDSDYFAEE